VRQCVNVFARKGVVPPAVKVRKQAEVDRYKAGWAGSRNLFGLLCSGAGHVFAGLPVRGALYAFAFLFLAFSAVFRAGVLRAVRRPAGLLQARPARRGVPAGLPPLPARPVQAPGGGRGSD